MAYLNLSRLNPLSSPNKMAGYPNYLSLAFTTKSFVGTKYLSAFCFKS